MKNLTTFLRIIHNGIVGFIRNFSLAVAAIAVMVITLTIVRFSILTNVTFGNTIAQITSQIDISVYLNNSDSSQQTTSLVNGLKKLPDVQSVQYLNKTQVLKAYENQNSSNQQLLNAISVTSNPLPATINIKPQNLNQISVIKNYLNQPSVVALQSDPPSYSGNKELAINRITKATNILRDIGVIAVVAFVIVSALIIFNTIQMTIFNRRDEIRTMRLLGANKIFIRGPFIVESIIYGLLAGILSVLIINEVFVTVSSTLKASSLGLLDISYSNTYFDNNFFKLLLIQVLIGVLIGVVSSYSATRKYLKFKVR